MVSLHLGHVEGLAGVTGRLPRNRRACSALGLRGRRGHAPRSGARHPEQDRVDRTAKTIDGIVIHDTEGRFIGSVRFLQRARARGSAHFVVSRRGQIVQLVPVGDVAWHAGNRRRNLHSIGIEHEGWAGRGRYTVAEYRASAQLVAYLAHRWGVPLHRRHIVGHDEVPTRIGPAGSAAERHTDPADGGNWRG